MGLSKKQQQNADRLKAALKQHNQQVDTQEVLKTAREMGDAAKAGDEDTLAELTKKARRRGWV